MEASSQHFFMTAYLLSEGMEASSQHFYFAYYYQGAWGFGVSDIFIKRFTTWGIVDIYFLLCYI